MKRKEGKKQASNEVRKEGKARGRRKEEREMACGSKHGRKGARLK